MSEKVENSQAVEGRNTSQEPTRNIFDIIGDFFAKMLKGIFVFVFGKLPLKLWRVISNIEHLKKFFRYLYSIARAILLCVLWIVAVFLGWWIFLREQFERFWRAVWDWICMLLCHTLVFLRANAGWIWMVLALMGSAYGLLYVTLKRRAKKKGKEFSGVLGWLHRKKKEASSTDGNDLHNGEKQS